MVLAGRLPETVTGSAQNLGDLPDLLTYSADRDTEDELWTFYDRIPEAYWFVQFLGRSGRNLRLSAAKKIPGNPDPVPLGKVVHVEEETGEFPADVDLTYSSAPMADGSVIRYESATEARAAELLAMIEAQDGGQAAILQRSFELLAVVGKGYWVGHVEEVSLDADGRLVTDDIAANTGGTITEVSHWDVYSTDDLKRDKVQKRWYLVDSQNKRVMLHKDTHVYALRDRHPRRHTEVKSSFRAARDALRRIAQAQAAMQAIADSRLAMRGLLLVAADWDIAPPDEWDAERDGEWNFADFLHKAILAPISNPATSVAAAPLVVEVPFEYLKDGWAFIDFFSKYDEHLVAMIAQDLDRIAVAWDAPTQMMKPDGYDTANHWNIWAAQESADKTTWRPLGSLISGTASRYLQRQLNGEANIDANIDADEARTICVVADTSGIMAKASRTQEVAEMWDRDLISDDAARGESGFAPETAPSEEEAERRFLRRVLLGSRDESVRRYLLDLLGYEDVPEADGAGAAATFPEGPASSDGPGGPSADGPPDVPDGMRAAASDIGAFARGLGLHHSGADLDHNGLMPTVPLEDLRHQLVAVSLAESCALEAVRRAGNILKQRVPKDMSKVVDKLEPWQVAPLLGVEQASAIWATYDEGRPDTSWSPVTFFRLAEYLSMHFGRAVSEEVVTYALSTAKRRSFDDLGSGSVLDPHRVLDILGVSDSVEVG